MNKVPDPTKIMREVPLSSDKAQSPRRAKPIGLLDKETATAALKQAFVMLRPDIQWKNPVMFVVEVGAFLTLLFIVQAAWGGKQVRCR